jgi:LmbE family N-acetylglucosaminyl deacetylase
MKSTRISNLILFCFFFHITLSAQQSGVDILQKLQNLGTSTSVLYIAAHPDDENTRLLSYLSNELHLRTAYLSLTRGDGGQNLIGSETEEALGLIRTQELLAARRVDGAEQFFTRAFDFGYSKTPEETFRIWNRDSILHDVVWVIRNFRPDVIITRFPTTGEGGHGHHTASAMLAVDAFTAAADPKRFPNHCIGTILCSRATKKPIRVICLKSTWVLITLHLA